MINKTEKDIKHYWKTKKIEVSIVCITYNHENYIEECIDSFLMQETSFPFEVIIHDDASTDRTRELIEKYRVKYPTIIKTIYEEKNQYSKNVLLLEKIFPFINGKYVATCEGDDYWNNSEKIQKQYDFLEQNSKYSAVGHMTRVVNKYNEEIDWKLSIKPGNVTKKEINSFNICAHTSSLFYRRSVDEYINANSSLYKDIKSPGDTKKILTIIKMGKLYVLPEYYSTYRYQSCAHSYSSNPEVSSLSNIYKILEEQTKLAKKLELNIDYLNAKYELILKMFISFLKKRDNAFVKVFSERNDKFAVVLFIICNLPLKTFKHFFKIIR